MIGDSNSEVDKLLLIAGSNTIEWVGEFPYFGSDHLLLTMNGWMLR